VAEVPGVRAEEDWHPEPGRLDHALTPAAVIQAPPGESDGREPPRGAELAHRVNQDDGRSAFRQRATPDVRQASGLDQLGHLVEPLRRPRDEDQLERRVTRSKSAEYVEDDPLLRFVRAARDPDRFALADSEQSAEVARLRVVLLAEDVVVLHIPGHADA